MDRNIHILFSKHYLSFNVLSIIYFTIKIQIKLDLTSLLKVIFSIKLITKLI